MKPPQLENKNTKNTVTFETLRAAQVVALSGAQEIALQLYGLGMNVFPQPYGKKSGYPWRGLQFVRLPSNDLLSLFDGRSNLAVMCGRTSGNLFVIDCETEAAYKAQYRALKNAGIPIWAVRTNGIGNGGHFYLRCKDGEVKGIRAGQRPGYEVRGNRCYVLAPPSLHPRTKALYQWGEQETPDPPLVSLDQLPWLGLELTRDKPYPISPSPLSQKTRDFIAYGALAGERNNRLFEAACDLAGNQVDFHSTTRLLLPIAQKCGLPTGEAQATIYSAYSKQRTPARPDNQVQFHLHHKVRAWVETRVWSGRTGQTDRAVLLACCERAMTANEKGVFRLSSRELAELARMGRNTASRAIKRLCDQKLLNYCGQDKQSGANLYRFGSGLLALLREKIPVMEPLLLTSNWLDSGSLTGKTDAIERGALGKTAYCLYQHMLTLEQAARGKVLAQGAGLSLKQVYRALSKLKAYDLVVKESGGFVARQRTDEQLDDQVALPAGTLGKAAYRRLRHNHERALKAARKLRAARLRAAKRRLQQQVRIRAQSENRSGASQGTQQVSPADAIGGEVGHSRGSGLKSVPKRWRCPYCGQVWSLLGMEPPDVCDYCQTMTTWQQLE